MAVPPLPIASLFPNLPPSLIRLTLPPLHPPAPPLQVQRWPGNESLGDAKEVLDFASSAWTRMFCRLQGGDLLLDALLLHTAALEQGQRHAQPAVLAALQALHSLVRCVSQRGEECGGQRGSGWPAV